MDVGRGRRWRWRWRRGQEVKKPHNPWHGVGGAVQEGRVGDTAGLCTSLHAKKSKRKNWKGLRLSLLLRLHFILSYVILVDVFLFCLQYFLLL